jgi:cell division protein FtsI/penicillin-binding protein 2
MATPVQVADMIATVSNVGISNQVNIVDSIID